jgi:hypothetical protein
MQNIVTSIWNKFSDQTKVRIISVFNTAISAFFLTVLITLSTGQIEWSTSFFIGLLSAGAREAIKAVVNIFVPVKLGGNKV